MRYLKSYKIFESSNSSVDKYLSILGTTRDEVIKMVRSQEELVGFHVMMMELRHLEVK